MALVQMKCPNCGGTLDVGGSQFSCSHCGTIILNITEQQIDGDIATIGVEEFAQKLQEAQNKFVIRLDEKVQIFDVETAVTNKKIDDARALLARGAYDAVAKCLSGVSDDILSAERLRFLAHYKVQSEEPLMFGKGKFQDSYFPNIVKRCDPETKKTYLKLQEVRVENERIAREIAEGDRLLEVELYKEALLYANKMCQKYPYKAEAWYFMASAKRSVQENYAPAHEYEMAKICPDGGWHAYKLLEKIEEYYRWKDKPQESTESQKEPKERQKKPKESQKEPTVDIPELDFGTTTFGLEMKCAHCGEKAFIDMESFLCPACQHEFTNEQIQAQNQALIEERRALVEERRALIAKNKTINDKKGGVTAGVFSFLTGLFILFALVYGGMWASTMRRDGISHAELAQIIRIAATAFMALSLVVTLLIQCAYRQKGGKALHWTSSSRNTNLALLIMNIVLIALAILLSH